MTATQEAPAAKKMTLWDIGNELTALNSLLDEVEGDISDPAVCDAVDAFFAEIAGKEEQKLDNYIGYIKRLEMNAARDKGAVDMLKAELADATRKVTSGENKIKWLKANLMTYLKATGRTKAETASGKIIAIQSNGGNFPIIFDDRLPVAEEIPEQFRKTSITIDVDRVYKALEAGEDVPFAKLGQRGQHVRIR